MRKNAPSNGLSTLKRGGGLAILEVKHLVLLS
jgi:hypothetical protein